MTYFKKLDLFAHPIALKYNGDTCHKTRIGSVFSLIYIAIVATFIGL